MTEIDKKKKFIIDVTYYGLIVGLILMACKYLLPAMIPFIGLLVAVSGV